MAFHALKSIYFLDKYGYELDWHIGNLLWGRVDVINLERNAGTVSAQNEFFGLVVVQARLKGKGFSGFHTNEYMVE